MASDTIRVNTKQIVIRLKMPFMFGFRMTATLWVLRLAGWISPTTIEITHVGD